MQISPLPVLRMPEACLTTHPASKVLDASESRQLDECENIIRRGWDTFLEVGRALAMIRDRRLYRDKYATYEDYCRQKWEYSKTHANRLVEAAAVAAVLTPIGVTVKSESQIRPLAGLPPQKIPAAWKRAEELAGGAQVTAKIVRRAVEDFKTGPHPFAETANGSKPIGKRTASSLALRLIDKIEKAARTNDLGTILAALKTLRKHLKA